LFLFLVSWSCSFARPTIAKELVGVPRIVDGDTVEIDHVKIGFSDIDAPETAQCLDAKGEITKCGIEARNRLIEKAGSRSWDCSVVGLDRFGRSLASCRVGGEDIQRWMVRSGSALSFTRYSYAYDADEEAAREARAGLWSGAFIASWDWRSRSKSTEILGAASVPIDAQKIFLHPSSGAEMPRTTSPSMMSRLYKRDTVGR
jgi:endonuclease YncB( thermonuclease family)